MRTLLIACLALLVVARQAAAGDAATACPMPADLLPGSLAAPLALDRLTAGRPLVVVALGSASTAGRAAGGAEHAWPARLAAALAARYPAAQVIVHNAGLARQTVHDMIERIDRDVLPAMPDLVIWETGTVDAARGLDLDTFRAALHNGVGRLRASEAEVVLMDMQFSRFTEMLISLERYAGEMREVAMTSGAVLFPRRELMRHWAETGALDYRVQDPAAQTALARRLYDCLGRAVAEFLTHDATAPTEAVKQ